MWYDATQIIDNDQDRKCEKQLIIFPSFSKIYSEYKQRNFSNYKHYFTVNVYPAHKFNPLPGKKFFDSSKLKEFTDDNFKFNENGR